MTTGAFPVCRIPGAPIIGNQLNVVALRLYAHEHNGTPRAPSLALQRAMKTSMRWLIAVPFLTSCVTQSGTVASGTPAPDLGKRAVYPGLKAFA